MSETEVTTEVQFDNSDDLDTFSAGFFGQKQPVASETKEEVEQEKPEAEAEKEAEAQEETDPNAEADAEYKEAPPKKKTVQDRIDELVKQREDVKREADARIDALRKEFEDKIKALEPQAPAKVVQGEPSPAELKEDGTEKYPLGEFDPQYIRDLTRYTLEAERTQMNTRAEQEQRQRQEQAAQVELTQNWNQKVVAATAEYPDLVEKGQAMLAGLGDLPNDYSTYLSNLLMSMDKGPDVLYYLSNNPQEAATIVNSGAQKATLALGRIEAKFLEADSQKQAAKPKVSNAPPPPPVRARGTNGAFISVAPDTDDLDAFSTEFFRKK